MGPEVPNADYDEHWRPRRPPSVSPYSLRYPVLPRTQPEVKAPETNPSSQSSGSASSSSGNPPSVVPREDSAHKELIAHLREFV